MSLSDRNGRPNSYRPNNVILEGEGEAKFERAFHSCLCKNFMDGNNIAYNQKENDLGQHLSR